jgi:NitT/TauT family transport system substrate-binding protein
MLWALVLSSGCAPKSDPPLRMGITPWPGYEFLYLAQEKGFFRDEGVDVRIVQFSVFDDAQLAFERGQIDGLGATSLEVLLANGVTVGRLQMIWAVDSSEGADVILARAGIADVAGLRGARVGVGREPLAIYMLCRALEKHGLKLTDVKTVAMTPESYEDAFRKGELDAIVTHPPASAKLLRGAGVNLVFSSAEIPGEIVDVFAVNAEAGAKRSGEMTKMLRALRRALDYSAANPAEAHRIMAAREGIPAEECAAALVNGLRIVPAAEQAEFLRAGGRLEIGVDRADALLRGSGQLVGADRRKGIVNPAFAEAALRP